MSRGLANVSRARWSGLARLLLVGIGAGAIVFAVPALPDAVTVPLTLEPLPTAIPGTRVPINSITAACPGPHTEGLAAVPPVAGSTTVLVATPPTSVLKAALAPVSASTRPGETNLVTVPSERSLGSRTTSEGVLAAPVSGASSVVIDATESLAPGLSAMQTWVARTGDDRGLSAGVCGVPAVDMWLIAGGAEVSRRERLVLTNPGGNPVTARISVYGTSGVLPTLTSDDLTIGGRSRRVLLLDALTAQEASPLIRVRVDGGSLGAAIHDSLIDAAIGQGADDATPAARPAEEQVIPLVPTGVALLRVGVPGDLAATLSVSYLTPDGALPATGLASVRIGATSTRDLPLEDPPRGTYGVLVSADQPVVSAVQARRVGTADVVGDFSWSTATLPISSLAGAPLSGDPSGAATGLLSVASGPDGAEVEVVTVAPGGATTATPLTFSARTTGTVEVTGSASVWLRVTSGEVNAAVSISDATVGELFSVIALSPARIAVDQDPIRDVTR